MTATKINIEDLPTKYDAQETESRIYKFWEEGDYFKADNQSALPQRENNPRSRPCFKGGRSDRRAFGHHPEGAGIYRIPDRLFVPLRGHSGDCPQGVRHGGQKSR